MSFVRDRNPRIQRKFSDISLHYMRIGQELGVRWDYAFYQMLVETAFLKYNGDVRAHQNNFAGIAATGGGVPGESFPSVAEGVRAHLQHLMVYAGMPVDAPVAERTRKVQDWGIMKKWHRTMRGPVRYDQMTSKWSPGDRGYPRDIEAVANRFMSGRCRQPDPAPELIAGIRNKDQRTASVQTVRTKVQTAGTALPSSASATRSALGAPRPDRNARRGSLTRSTSQPAASVLNSASNQTSPSTSGSTTASGNAAPTGGAAAPAESSVGRFASNLFAAITPPPLKQNKKANPAPKSCRVWTASYGGQNALIIKSVSASHVNYTVLDVNNGREEREADAYIAAYAKGGKTIAKFADPQKALAKAFKLCPTGNKSS